VSLDLGSPALEVAIGLAFVFFLLSTLVSAITEGIAWLTRQRSMQLEQGIKGLLGDNDLAREVLGHALVRSDVRRPAKARAKGARRNERRPSYVSARNFSLALIDTLAKRGRSAQNSLEEVESGAAEIGDEALEEQLSALFGDPAVTELRHFRKSAEVWFDDQMDRVSGWYKRWAQRVTCIVAVVVTVALNVSAVRVAETLANDQTVRGAIAARAESATGDATAAGQNAEYAVKTLDSLKLPILWNDATDEVNASLVAGWLVTFIAISLGAPFWFDALSKLARLRTTGKKPEATRTG
jgi:hypothetical protein